MGKFTATSASGYVATNLQNQGATENDWVKYQVSTKDKSALTLDSSTTATSLVTSTEIKQYEQVGLYNSTDGFKIITLGSVSYDSGTGLYTTDITSAGLTTAPTNAHTLAKRNDLNVDSSSTSTLLVAVAPIEDTEAIIAGEDVVVYNSTDGYRKVEDVTVSKSISGSNILYTVDISSASLTTAPTSAYTIRPRVLVSTGSSDNTANVDDIVLDVDTGSSDTTSIVTNYMSVSDDERYRIKNATKIDTDTDVNITPSAVSETYNDPTTVDPFSDSSEVAFYMFENNANDEHGSYNGTWTGTEAYITGKFGQAASFTDTSDVDTGFKIELNANDLSVSLWVKKTTSDSESIFGGSNWGTAIGVDDSNGVGLTVSLYYDNTVQVTLSDGNSAYEKQYTSSTIENDGYFHNIIFSYNQSANTVDVMIDGGTIETLSFSQAITKTLSYNFHIGSSGYYTNGISIIDQVRIFNKTLSASEMQQLYQEGQYKYDITIPTQSSAPTKAVVRPTGIDVLSLDETNTSYDSVNDIVEMKYDTENKDPSTFSCVQVKWQAQRVNDENSKIQVDLWKN